MKFEIIVVMVREEKKVVTGTNPITYKAPWSMVYDPELNDLDYRVFMLIISRQNQIEYYNGKDYEYTLDEEWLAEMLNHTISDIVGSIGRLKSAGCLGIEDKNGHYVIMWDRISRQAERKNNWKKVKEAHAQDEGNLENIVKILKQKGGKFAVLGNELQNLAQADVKDNELDELFKSITLLKD